ncbi:MAG: site-specific DNA-methyltransferase, partial [Candidatus Gracilibacteria bacterium]|nr:site-specific DNA-methyltransferase [Candidatus Gracilibacteria bacterium]
MAEQNTNSEEIKQNYFQIKSSAVEHLRDLIHDLKGNVKTRHCLVSTDIDLQDKIKELEQELENLKNTKKYGLVWDNEKEPEQVVLDCQNKLPILKEKKDKKIINDDSGESNILIQGDNYHALQVLSYTHKEAIDVIYIDPPYNTGNKDFIYNDKYIDKEDTYRHSKWLNFMSKRLNLAYDLLKEDGVIFISIDDNEQAQLKLLCDEIFGEENFVAKLVWKKTSNPNV